MNSKLVLGALGSTFLLLLSASADDWPQWQGPNRDAISKETGLLKEWPAGGPPLAWKNEQLGGGDGAPSIAAGRIFGMGHRDSDEVVWALSEKDGKELWTSRLGPAFEQNWPQGKEGPACTPTVDGERLYAIGLAGNVVCLKVKDGTILWQRNLVKDFGGVIPTWSYRESPLIDGNKLICTPGSDDAILAALDKLTGSTIWKSKAPGTSSNDSGRRDDSPRAPGANPGFGGRNRGLATAVTGTKDPELFQSEHWGMSAFACEIPNGKYLAKLYFAETYEGITGAGQRVFSLNVEGHELKDFDIWAKAGGSKRAYIETVPADVTNGQFRIAFTTQTQSPAINAIEIIPQAEAGTAAASSTATVRIKAGRSTPFTDSVGQVWQADKGFEGGMAGGLAVTMGGPGGRGGNSGGSPRGFGGGPGGMGGAGSGAAYSSAIAIDFEGQREYVQLTAKSLIGVAAADGKFLWKYDRPANRMGINCSTPIYHDGMIFAASAYNAGGGAVRLHKNANGEITAEEVWFSRQMENHHGGVLLIDGALYGANGGNGGGYLACLDFKTGEVLWNEADREKRRLRKGSVAFADGRIYYRTEQGALVLIEPSRKEYLERGRFDQPDRTETPAWAHPVIANGKLYVRDQNTLFCYNVKAPYKEKECR